MKLAVNSIKSVTSLSFGSYDGVFVSGQIFLPKGKPAAVMQIIKGLNDTASGIEALAKSLTGLNLIVAVSEYRWRTLKLTAKSEIEDHDWFFESLGDCTSFTDYLKNKFGLPVILYSSGYGSYLAQSYLTRCDTPVAVIMTDTYYLKRNLPAFINKTLLRFQSTYLTDLSEVKFMMGTNLELRSREDRQSLTAGFYLSLFDGVARAFKKNARKRVNKNIIITLLSPESSVKQYNKLYKTYLKMGLEKVFLTTEPLPAAVKNIFKCLHM